MGNKTGVGPQKNDFSKPIGYIFSPYEISLRFFPSGCKIGVKFLIVDLVPESSKQSTST